jgi:hypothetical protein
MKYKIWDKVKIITDGGYSIDYTGTLGVIVGFANNNECYKIRLYDGTVWHYFGYEFKPVTKSLEELEVGDVIGDFNHGGVCKMKLMNKEVVCEFEVIGDFCKGTKPKYTIEELKRIGYTYYTPKKITVFKHKGKSYPVEEIIKKVKPR